MLPLVYSPKEPGQLVIRGYGPISVWSWDDGFLYDSVVIEVSAGGAIAAGTEGVFFRDIQNKNFRETNMSLSSQLPSGWEMIVLRIGLYVEGSPATRGQDPYITSTNVLAGVQNVRGILEFGYVEFIMDNSAVMASGPATRFPIFGGLGGHIDFSSNAIGAFAQVNNGTPAFMAVPPMGIPIVITDARTFRGTIHFYEAVGSLGANDDVTVQMGWHGFVKKPAM